MGMCYSCLVFQPQEHEYTMTPPHVHPCLVTFQPLPLGRQSSRRGRISPYEVSAEGAWLATRRGSLIPAGFIPFEGARYTILFSHGNAESLGQAMGYGKVLSSVLRCNFAAYEYTGYGNAQGRPSEKNTYADIRATYEWLVKDKGIDPERLIVIGRSVGSGPSVWLASRRDVSIAGLILVCGFTSIVGVVYRGWVPRSFDMYSNIKRIRRVQCPILAVHGTADEVIPFEHGIRLVEAAKDVMVDPFWIEGKGHNTAELDNWKETFKVYKRFLETVEQGQQQAQRKTADGEVSPA